MREVVIAEAARAPFGKRGGGLAEVHPADLPATALTAVTICRGGGLGTGTLLERL